jgi:hypothetical protein
VGAVGTVIFLFLNAPLSAAASAAAHAGGGGGAVADVDGGSSGMGSSLEYAGTALVGEGRRAQLRWRRGGRGGGERRRS